MRLPTPAAASAWLLVSCAAPTATPVVSVPPAQEAEAVAAPVVPVAPVEPVPFRSAHIARLTPEELAAMGFAPLRTRGVITVEEQQLIALMRATPYPSPDQPKIQARIAAGMLEFALATARDPELSPAAADKLVANTTDGAIRFTKLALQAATLHCSGLEPGCHQRGAWVIGLALWASGKPNDAAKVLREDVVQAIGEPNPSPLVAARGLLVLGLIAEDEGRKADARQLLSQANERAPQDAPILAVARAHGALGEAAK